MITLVIFFVIATQCLFIGPWGNFPLNDDWGHALLTLNWFQTGTFHSFIPITPSLILQAAWGKIFLSFSKETHVSLRLSNIVATGIFVIILNQIFRLVKIRPINRLLLMMVFITNPLVTYLSFSFMTDIFGVLVAYSGVLLWFLHLSILEKTGESRKATFFAVLGSLVMGLSFWTRQLSILVFPAAILSLVFKSSVRQVIKRYWLSFVAFAIGPVSYLSWAKLSHNLNSDFTAKVSFSIFRNLGDIISTAPIWYFYMTACALPTFPLLFYGNDVKTLFTKRGENKAFFTGLGLIFVSAIVIGFTGAANYQLSANIHRHFPFFGNILNPYGIGPITLTDVYIHNGPSLPKFFQSVWWVFEVVLALSFVVWFQMFGSGHPTTNKSMLPIQREGKKFGFSVILVTFATLTLCFGRGTFDRYLIAVLPALLLILGIKVESKQRPNTKKSLVMTGLIIFLYSFYGVGGVHDYFRWNERRWELIKAADEMGVSYSQLDAGHEANTWNYYSKAPGEPEPCKETFFFCGKRPFAIALNPYGDILARRKVNSWLGDFPDILIIKRK